MHIYNSDYVFVGLSARSIVAILRLSSFSILTVRKSIKSYATRGPDNHLNIRV